MNKPLLLKTILAVFILTFLLAGCGGGAAVLPHPLYFLDGSGESSQVWRLERDGVTLSRVTAEEMGVEKIAVSQTDGTLALVSDNQLILVDPGGEDRLLVADGDLVTTEGEESYFNNQVTSPEFSPDGKTLAYGLNGIHLYDLRSGEDEHVLKNLGNLLNEPFVYSKEVYSPGPWSPDGKRLLIMMSYYEGYTLAVMEPGAEQPFTRLRSDGAVCCMTTWLADGRSVLVASPYFTGALTGLWRFDAASGSYEYVIPGHNESRSANLVGWPFQSRKGDLTFFYLHLEDFPNGLGNPFILVRADRDGADMERLMPQEFHVRSMLWTEDGSQAVIAGSYDGEDNQLFLVNLSTQEIKVLMSEAGAVRDLAWGP